MILNCINFLRTPYKEWADLIMHHINLLETKPMVIKTENYLKKKNPTTSTDRINSRLNTVKESINEMEVRIGKITQKTALRENNLQSIERKQWLTQNSALAKLSFEKDISKTERTCDYQTPIKKISKVCTFRKKKIQPRRKE